MLKLVDVLISRTEGTMGNLLKYQKKSVVLLGDPS